MMKIVAMIPARLGSTRVKNKNLRLIDNKPLIQYILDSAKGSKFINEIFINSEGEIFRDIAERNQVKYYHRDEKLASDTATNDDFALDFIDNVDCDILIQLLPTSPFLTTMEIDSFISKMIEGDYETMISVSDVQIECMYNNTPINFDQKKQTPPSQLLTPIKAYACGIMGWESKYFRRNIEKFGAAYHGGDGKIGFFSLKGFSTVDIDNEEDFILAEAVAKSMILEKKQPEYYDPEKETEIFDADVDRILTGDGVQMNNQVFPNREQVSISEIINKNGRSKSWSHTVINSASNSATLIGQLPGEGNRMHYHHDWDEWWYIIEGDWEWMIDGEKKNIRAGEVVFINRNKKHKITAAGSSMAIRLAVSRYDVDHVYTEGDYKADE
jgi:CMP-N-acetylneuraminic acid synthetase/quercetin dioxygenase-like cupin family protein